MSEHSQKSLISNVQSLTTAPPGSALSKWQVLVRVIAISIPVLAAMPTATNLYYSWEHDIPFSQVSHRLAQYDLWLKNFECKIEYQAIFTGRSTRVDVGACSKTGDIALKISGQRDAVAYEWIPFDQLQKPRTQTSTFLNLLVTAADAQEKDQSGAAVPALRLAQAGMEVVCQSLQADKQIVRVVNEGGKCFRETFSPYLGQVSKREEVPCTSTCPAAK